MFVNQPNEVYSCVDMHGIVGQRHLHVCKLNLTVQNLISTCVVPALKMAGFSNIEKKMVS